jgi:hypothetical protein
MEEQYRRFCEALATAGTGTNSTNCEVCPIQTECEAFSATLSPICDYCEEYSCEAILFRYVITGEKPKSKM